MIKLLCALTLGAFLVAPAQAGTTTKAAPAASAASAAKKADAKAGMKADANKPKKEKKGGC